MKILLRHLMVISLLAVMPASLRAAEYFVSNAGSDAGSGADKNNAFLTIQHAVDQAKGGDTITVLDGVYHESVKINHSGEKNAPLTIRSQNHWGAKVIGAGDLQNCFSIGSPDVSGISYITIQGFDLNAPSTYGSGVASYNGAIHVTVEDVYAHDCGSSGIGLGDGDYRVVRNCVCAYNALLMPYCGSGISLYGRWKADDAGGFHDVVSGNVCYGNENGPHTNQTDGNGIIIDDFRDKQKYHAKQTAFELGYQGDDILVEGNLCFHNGGKGIIVYSSNNVTLANNTCVRNMRRANQGDDCGEITVSCSSHIVVANNIAVTSTRGDDPANHPRSSAYVFGDKNGFEYVADTTMQGTITVQHNLSFDANLPGSASISALGIAVPFAGENGNLAGVDPGLINPDDPMLWKDRIAADTPFAAYFGLKAQSPARAVGQRVEGSSLSTQANPDLGAFQVAGSRDSSSAPIPKGIVVLHNLVIGKGGDRDLHAEVAYPEKAPQPMPALVYIHGGGWSGGDYKQSPILKFAEAGYFAASIEYRLSGEAKWPAQIQDCRLAIRWLRANAVTYHVDPDHIGAWGDSAGGHLAAALGTMFDIKQYDGDGGNPEVSGAVQAVVDFYGPIDFVRAPMYTPKGLFTDSYQQNPELWKSASPIFYLKAGDPPMFIAHGDSDQIVPVDQSIRFDAALTAAGVPHQFLIVKNADHGFRPNPAGAKIDPSWHDIYQMGLSFCDRYLKPH